ncbi:cbb3-type cytochrome c oxidase subunit I [Acidianus brierleyi]|uniref:Cytochrome oxidase subunit I profile domain-containing protein n=1 Tax=Acidianus brierleyi TaxID=41673 RepID=A0A2U9IHI4_9CREN|nr:cbb3-type cytochrome c oxidase subunit I [Acidianus brierleyi]AWR95489.1 hypothetical protein DFR85_13685 [Acidianus brierleyi]
MNVRSSTLYFIGAISWLVITGLGAMNLRTYLLNEGSIKFDEIYYFMLTLHGDSGMIAFVSFSSLAISIFLIEKYYSLNYKILNSLFIIANIGIIIYFLGGPIIGWYMLYPLSTQSFNFIGIYGKYFWISYLGIFIYCISIETCSVYLWKKSNNLIFITLSLMIFSIPFLGATMILYILSIVKGISVSPIITSFTFWEYGSPDTYFLTFSVFALLYYIFKPFSTKWTLWSKYPLMILPFLIFANHLQTWPINPIVREASDFFTIILTGFLAILFFNLIIPLFKTTINSTIEFLGVITLGGFLISSIFSIILPFNFFDPIFHNTYYVVGSFHSIIWNFLITGFFLGFYIFTTNLEEKKELKNENVILKTSLITWLISSTILSYLMMYSGYEGLIRREVIFPSKFLPSMDLMTAFAFIAVTAISLAFSIELSKLISVKIKKIEYKKFQAKIMNKIRH